MKVCTVSYIRPRIIAMSEPRPSLEAGLLSLFNGWTAYKRIAAVHGRAISSWFHAFQVLLLVIRIPDKRVFDTPARNFPPAS